MPKKSIDFPKKITNLNYEKLKHLIELSIKEDFGDKGDITSRTLLKELKNNVEAKVIAKDNGVICGLEIVNIVYNYINPDIKIEIFKKDGDLVSKGDIILKLYGIPLSITEGERISLNFLGMMSGISTKVNRLVELIKGSTTKLLDTRKTLPGLREIEKYAVSIGGGYNHRLGLYDMILIKDNHIAAVGSIKRAVELAKEQFPENMVIEIEVGNLNQVEEALTTEADILMLDNMNNQMIKEAIKLINNEKYIEVSGNVDENRLIELAEIGVDFVSMGALTHTIKPLDLSLLI